MPLKTATYKVTTADGNFKIGRFAIEDLSLLPKRIVAQQNDAAVPHPWIIESLGGDKYRVKIMGAPLSTIQDRLAAHLIEEPSDEWTIAPTGQNLYTFSQNGQYIEVPTEESYQLKTTGTKPSQGFKNTKVGVA
ncbi:hypothetical protein P153DRAFT_355057 [Dothidotthia symphoricarpi CBS 119687]|uniref:Uncharacterized protein n=1 Tax=Dothidotthia symphoricarpi CBS 119687 TaxID=1392245 RepID=A0A6A6AKG7_9PLEO|nr:uncharacterized protein P153DRAFT_355057 [Dothidotthia symphoricarpi CBS 119687]KAF2132452.1 hypothetical protein P153DRAFT_355057 [Dothidotthia symphoricarpi CBS 119687]